MTTLRFGHLLHAVGIDPRQVRLLRHQTKLGDGRTPFELLKSDRDRFDAYQACQLHSYRAWFASPFWASFVGLADGRTLFAGLYEAGPPVLAADRDRDEALHGE